MKRILIALLALAPTLWFVNVARGVPHLGHFHDDGVYVGTAAAIAEGKGPRVESLPGEPFQVRYPPLFPLYLTPGAHNEVALAALLALTMAGLLGAVYAWRADALLVILCGWNAYAVLFANSALSEVFGTIWMVLAVALLERDRVSASAVASAAAYLTRTALIIVPAGAILWLLWRRRWKDALRYGAVFAPAFLAWGYFVATHTEPNVTGTRAFYSDYSKFFGNNMSLDLLPTVVTTNIPQLFSGAAGLLFFNGGDDFFEINFARLLLFAAIAGIIRRARAEGIGPFDIVAVLYCSALIVWNYIPQERFLFPILPLLLFGFLTEMRSFVVMLRASWVKQRGAAIVLGALTAAGLLWAAQRGVIATWRLAPSIPKRFQPLLPERAKAFEWIRANTPAGANFLAAEELSLRRATGRHGIGFHFPTKLYYLNDSDGIFAYHRDIVPRMRAENLQYLLIGPNDMELDLIPATREKVIAHWMALPELETVYESRLYRIRKLRSLQ